MGYALMSVTTTITQPKCSRCKSCPVFAGTPMEQYGEGLFLLLCPHCKQEAKETELLGLLYLYALEFVARAGAEFNLALAKSRPTGTTPAPRECWEAYKQARETYKKAQEQETAVGLLYRAELDRVYGEMFNEEPAQ